MELEKVRFIALFQLSSFYPSILAPHFSPDLHLFLGWRRTRNVHMDWGRTSPWVFGLSLKHNQGMKRNSFADDPLVLNIWFSTCLCCLQFRFHHHPSSHVRWGKETQKCQVKTFWSQYRILVTLLCRLVDAMFHLLSENPTNVILLSGICREKFINFLLLLVFWNCSILCCNF